MTNFAAAFNKSLELADALEAQKTAINSVFNDLKVQIKEASQGVIDIVITDGKREIEPEVNRFTPLAATLFAPLKYHKYRAISGEVVITDGKEFSLEIAEWKTSPEGGFPCTLTYSNRDIEVGDKVSLEFALKDLVESTHAGVIFKALLDKHKETSSQ